MMWSSGTAVNDGASTANVTVRTAAADDVETVPYIAASNGRHRRLSPSTSSRLRRPASVPDERRPLSTSAVCLGPAASVPRRIGRTDLGRWPTSGKWSGDRFDRVPAAGVRRTARADMDCCATRHSRHTGHWGSRRVCRGAPVSSIKPAARHLPGQFCSLAPTS